MTTRSAGSRETAPYAGQLRIIVTSKRDALGIVANVPRIGTDWMAHLVCNGEDHFAQGEFVTQQTCFAMRCLQMKQQHLALNSAMTIYVSNHWNLLSYFISG